MMTINSTLQVKGMAYNKGVALNQREERENAGALIYWQEDIDTHSFIM